VVDRARGTTYTPWFIDGSRNFAVSRPMLLYSPLWWIDPVTVSYTQTRIVGTYPAPPTNPTTAFVTNDMIWNSQPAVGESIGWVMLDQTQTDASGWKPFGVITSS